jgi:putative colanic acid biosynthesis UDP-glucose lipid carrier transferase
MTGGVTFKMKHDPRITRMGRFIRKTSIDELPQLWNVIKGDMSLVGPRPHAVQHDEEYSRRITDYFARHHLKPGMTGLAQVRGRDAISLGDRTKLDEEYVEIRSSRVDAKILLMTVGTVFSSSGDVTEAPSEE